jgi:hypothetical protein
MIRTLFLLAVLTACSQTTQYSSGADYVAARGENGPLDIDADIARIAAVEPDLRVPARIGIAQIVNGQLSLPDAATADLFAGLAQRHAGMGNFIPVSPLIAAMVTGSDPSAAPERYGIRPEAIVHDIRLTAARQHLDYVLIYEVGAHSARTGTVFALADVTLIGAALLPTRSIAVAGIGQALFVDVRNGYPYGTAQATADLSGLAHTFGADRREDALRAKAILKTTGALIPEVETMLADLMAQAKG